MKKSHLCLVGAQVLCFAYLAHNELRGADDDFLSWSRSDCNSIVKKASSTGGSSFGRVLLGQMDTVLSFWITDTSAKAVARITQLEERQTNDRTIELYESLRSNSAELHTLVVLTSSIQTSLYGGVYFTGVAPERLAKIFLEDAKDDSRFLRAHSIEAIPFDVEEIFGRGAHFMRNGFMIHFHRNMDDGSSLIENLKQEIRFHLPTDSGVLNVKFKLSDFKVQGIEEL